MCSQSGAPVGPVDVIIYEGRQIEQTSGEDRQVLANTGKHALRLAPREKSANRTFIEGERIIIDIEADVPCYHVRIHSLSVGSDIAVAGVGMRDGKGDARVERIVDRARPTRRKVAPYGDPS